jgi:CelD/BcsL family acetyltransferase involved in cellulose biosynthesis
MPDIAIEIVSPGLEIVGDWTALSERAPPNVFMHPAALHAAHDTGFAKVHVLQAWDASAQPRRLVGLWALQEVHITPIGPAFLAAPPFNYAFLSNPVVERELADVVIPAFFDAVASGRSLPNVIRLRYLDGNSPCYPAILGALEARGGQVLKMSERERPYASRDTGLKRSGSTRKKLRQDWNRLSALGTVDIVNDRSCEAVRDAFETYLAMEAESWKGAHGTALLCDEEDSAFARRMVGDLAAHGSSSVAVLRVDGRPIATQVLLYSGAHAYTWKTAFNAEFAKYSPGAQLVDKMTERLFATDDVEAIESCSPEGGFMNQLWDGRRATVDLLADVGARRSLGFAAVMVGERGYAQLRGLRNRLRAMNWSAAPKRRGLAASR